jgi:hypothetical protein
MNQGGAGPAVLQHDTGCPTRGSFTGGLLRALPGMVSAARSYLIKTRKAELSIRQIS